MQHILHLNFYLESLHSPMDFVIHLIQFEHLNFHSIYFKNTLIKCFGRIQTIGPTCNIETPTCLRIFFSKISVRITKYYLLDIRHSDWTVIKLEFLNFFLIKMFGE